jgi:hypothetical protein
VLVRFWLKYPTLYLKVCTRFSPHPERYSLNTWSVVFRKRVVQKYDSQASCAVRISRQSVVITVTLCILVSTCRPISAKHDGMTHTHTHTRSSLSYRYFWKRLKKAYSRLKLWVYVFINGGRDSVVDIATHYELNGPGLESRWGRNFPCHPDRPHAHEASCTMATSPFPSVRRPEPVADYSPPSSAELRMGWSYSPATPLRVNRRVMVWPLPFTFTCG